MLIITFVWIKKDIVLAELEACDRLLKYARDQTDKNAIEKEIAELKMALDLMPWQFPLVH